MKRREASMRQPRSDEEIERNSTPSAALRIEGIRPDEFALRQATSHQIHLGGIMPQATLQTDAASKAAKPFLTDVKTLRDRARKNIAEGAMTWTYKGDPKQSIEILQSVLATEIVCVLRYTMHAVSAAGLASGSVKAEFAEHAKEEQEHMMAVAERITQLGGEPDFNPEGLASRSVSQYSTGPSLIDTIKENLIAERT